MSIYCARGQHHRCDDCDECVCHPDDVKALEGAFKRLTDPVFQALEDSDEEE